MRLKVNGQVREFKGDPGMPLLWVLRDEFKLTGTKFGCGVAQCGACTIHVNGMPIRACVMPASAAKGAEITTIEGASGPVAEKVKQAWQSLDVPQCGYCQSGQIMTAIALLSEVPKPSEEEIDAGMTGNVCRCATYPQIRAAIHKAAEGMED